MAALEGLTASASVQEVLKPLRIERSEPEKSSPSVKESARQESAPEPEQDKGGSVNALV